MGILLWWIIGSIILAGGAILIAAIITKQVIKDLLNSDKDGFKEAKFATVLSKKLEGEHTVVKVKLTDFQGNSCEREIRSTQGATVKPYDNIYYND